MNIAVEAVDQAVAGDVRANRPSPLDFIGTYVKYADIFEAPPEAHAAVATTLISAAVNGAVWIENGGQKLSLDFWTLLLSGSGVGRNTLTSLLWPVLDAAGLGNLARNTSWGSKTGFYQDLAENPRGFFVWEELSVSLKALSDSRLGEAKQWLTNVYDNFRVPASIKYRKKGEKSDTPEIVFNEPPRTSILATSSQDWFVASLAEEDSLGGFIPRWFIVEMPVLDRAIPVPKFPDKGLIQPLTDCLREVGHLKGTVDLSKVKDRYEEWYVETRKRFADQTNVPMAIAFWNRHRVHLLKLAAIYGIADSGGLTVTPESMERAITSATASEKTVFSLIEKGLSREGAAVDKLAQCILNAGIDGMPRSEFTKTFQSIRWQDRLSRLATLIEAGTVKRFTRATGGRSAEVLVHNDFVEQHSREYPDDKLL